MADSSSEEKTEKPSAQKLRKAREEGQLPRSKDMGLAASLFAAFVVISSSFPWYADFVRESFISVHQYAQEINNPEVIGQFLRHHLLILGKFILTLLPMPAAALLSSLVPGGWLFLPKKILPDFSKISPLKGIGRLFSSEHLAETGKMTVKSVVVLVMLWVSLRNNFAAFLGLQALPFKLAMNEGLSLYACVMRNFVILFIFFALIDVPLAKGTDEIALYIRQVAAENQVEVVEFPRLARSVYYTTQVNQQIPFQLYRAIAHVLTYVLQMKHWREGAQPRPALNRHISIPKEVLKLDGENNYIVPRAAARRQSRRAAGDPVYSGDGYFAAAACAAGYSVHLQHCAGGDGAAGGGVGETTAGIQPVPDHFADHHLNAPDA